MNICVYIEPNCIYICIIYALSQIVYIYIYICDCMPRLNKAPMKLNNKK